MMTSVEDPQSIVHALHNQTFALYKQLMKHLSTSPQKCEAEQHAMTEFFAVVPRISNLQARAFQYKMKIEYLNKRIPQSGHNGNCFFSSILICPNFDFFNSDLHRHLHLRAVHRRQV